MSMKEQQQHLRVVMTTKGRTTVGEDGTIRSTFTHVLPHDGTAAEWKFTV